MVLWWLRPCPWGSVSARTQGNFLGYFQSLPLGDPSDFVPAGPRAPTRRPMGTTFASSTLWCI